MSRSPRYVSRDRAFALVATVLILALATVVTARLTMRAHREARATLQAQHDLAWRWLRRSAEANLLPRAQSILSETSRGPASDRASHRAGRVQARLVLDGNELVVRLEDESSKPHPESFVVRDVNELADRLALALPEHEIDLRPRQPLDAENDQEDRWLTYRQVARQADVARVWGHSKKPGLTDRLTVFGDGRINLRTIDPERLHEALRPTLTLEDAETLCRLVRTETVPNADAALASLGLNRRQQERIAGRLIDFSASHGVWLRWAPASGPTSGFAAIRSMSDEGSENVGRLIW